MHKISASLIACLFLVIPALADSQFWRPDPAEVQKAEASLGPTIDFSGFTCPKKNIDDFARYYVGVTDRSGRRLIEGQFLLLKDWPKETAGIYIQTTTRGIADGGCSIANVSFDAKTLKLVQAKWGGV